MEKRLKSIVFSSILLAFCLSVLEISAFAWFSINKEVKMSATNTRIELFDAQADYIVYYFDSKANSVHYTGKYNDESDPRITALNVPFYDTIFKQRNRYTPVIIRVALSGVKLQEGIVNVQIDRNTALSRADDGGYFTDLMRFTILKGTSIYDEDADRLYKNVDEAVFTLIESGNYSEDDADDPYLFKGASKLFDARDYGNGSQAYTENYDYITLSLPYGAADFVGGVFNFYIYITYDKEITESIGVFGSVASLGQMIVMRNDLTQMKISFEPNV